MERHEKAEQIYLEAVAAKESGNAKEALLLITYPLMWEPHVEYNYLRAWCYLRLGLFDQAIDELILVQEQSDEDTLGRIDEAELQKMLEEAKSGKAAVKERKTESDFYQDLMSCYKRGDGREALRCIADNADAEGLDHNVANFYHTWANFQIGALDQALKGISKLKSTAEVGEKQIAELIQSVEDAKNVREEKEKIAATAIKTGSALGVLSAYVSGHHGDLQVLVRESARLRKKYIKAELGASKLGGNPDLPVTVVWPRAATGQALSFLCQINLSEISRNFGLPKTGLLSFFYDNDEQPWGDEVSPSLGWRVIFNDSTDGLSSLAPPDETSEIFEERALQVHCENTIPDASIIIANPDIRISPFLLESLILSLDTLYEDGPINRLFGHPQSISAPLEKVCQQIAGSKEERRLHGEHQDWQLLLQLDSDPEIGMTW